MLSAYPTATGNVIDAIVEVKQAVDHGKQGHTEMGHAEVTTERLVES